MPASVSCVVDAVARLDQLRVVGLQRDQLDFVGRDRHRPHDAVLVVILLDRRGDDAGDADAVAAHLHRLLHAVGIEEIAAHRLRVLRAQEEDLADLDAAVAVQRAALRNARSDRRATPGGSRPCAAGVKSRPTLTPVRCRSAWLAPVTKSTIAATSASMWTGAFKPTGPAKPVGAPVTSRTAASVASSRSRGAEGLLELDLVDLAIAAHHAPRSACRRRGRSASSPASSARPSGTATRPRCCACRASAPWRARRAGRQPVDAAARAPRLTACSTLAA